MRPLFSEFNVAGFKRVVEQKYMYLYDQEPVQRSCFF